MPIKSDVFFFFFKIQFSNLIICWTKTVMDWALFDNCDFFGSPASERTRDSLNCKNLKIDRKSPMMAGKGNSHDKFLSDTAMAEFH